MKHFGTRQAELLKRHRIGKKLSQMELSTLLGSAKGSGQHYSNIERSKAGLPPKHIMALCQALEIPISAMVDAMVQDYRDNLEAIIWSKEDEQMPSV